MECFEFEGFWLKYTYCLPLAGRVIVSVGRINIIKFRDYTLLRSLNHH